MFVNVILAKYEQWAEMDSLPVTVHHLRAFRDVWKTIDHDAERWIDHGDMQRLLDKLPRQLAFDELMGEEDIEVSELRLPSLPDGSKGKSLFQPRRTGAALSGKCAFNQPSFYARWFSSANLSGDGDGAFLDIDMHIPQPPS